MASATASSSRSDDDAISVISWRRRDKEIAAVPPPPLGLMEVAGDLCVARRRRCPCIASSALLDIPSQAPSANIIVFMKRDTKYANRRRWDSNPRAQLITRQPDFESGPLRPLRYSSISKRLQPAGREMSSQEGRGKFGGSTWESRWYSMTFRGTSRSPCNRSRACATCPSNHVRSGRKQH